MIVSGNDYNQKFNDPLPINWETTILQNFTKGLWNLSKLRLVHLGMWKNAIGCKGHRARQRAVSFDGQAPQVIPLHHITRPAAKNANSRVVRRSSTTSGTNITSSNPIESPTPNTSTCTTQHPSSENKINNKINNKWKLSEK